MCVTRHFRIPKMKPLFGSTVLFLNKFKHCWLESISDIVRSSLNSHCKFLDFAFLNFQFNVFHKAVNVLKAEYLVYL